MRHLRTDLRFAVRLWSKQPLLALAILALLTAGIGINVALFSLVNSILLRPLPYRDSDRLVAVFEWDRDNDMRRNPTSPANYLDWRNSRTLEQFTAAHPWSPVLKGAGRTVQLQALKASPQLFALLGQQAELGRAFQPSGVEAVEDRVVVLGHEVWQRQFGGDPSLLGSMLNLDGADYQVIGIMPAGFRFPPFWAEGAEMWAPLIFSPDQAARPGDRFLRVFARLREGADLTQAQQEMSAMGLRLQRSYPDENRNIEMRVESLQEPVVSAVRPALKALAAAVAFVLIIVCINVASLLMARAVDRRGEMALRRWLGAEPKRLLAQLLTENLLLSGVGGLAGFGLGYAIVRALPLLLPADLPRSHEIAFDWSVLFFACAVSLLTGLLFGVLPAAQSYAQDSRRSMAGGRTVSSSHRLWGGRLAALQLALTVTLLTSAGLMSVSFLRLSAIAPGFEQDGRVTMALSLAGSPNRVPHLQAPFFRQIRQAVKALPGVLDVAVINHLPVGGDLWSTRISWPGQPADSKGIRSAMRTVTPGYFKTLAIPLLEGRDFPEGLTDQDAPLIIVNRELARRLWPDEESAVGRQLKRGRPESSAPWMTVIGVAGNVRQGELADAIAPEIFFPYAQNPFPWYSVGSLVASVEGDMATASRLIADRVAEIDPDLAVSGIRDLSQIIYSSLAQPRFQSALMGAFGVAAMLLATVGLYGLIAHWVARQVRETGIRMALGARPSDILRFVLGHGFRVVVLGTVSGLGLSILLTTRLQSLLYQVDPLDPRILGGSCLLMALTALAACLIPAGRAARLDPARSLRSE